MENTTGHILKGDTVNLRGSFVLDVEQPFHQSSKKKTTAAAAPQARIVENRPGFAVIEVTCCCGAKTHIRCEYSGVKSLDGEFDKSIINGENNNES